MFTPRSARARQVFARVPGRSSISMANSFVVGMLTSVRTFTEREARSRAGSEDLNLVVIEIIHLLSARVKIQPLLALNARLQNRPSRTTSTIRPWASCPSPGDTRPLGQHLPVSERFLRVPLKRSHSSH